MDVLLKLSGIVGEALDLDDLQLLAGMTAKDVDGWDSLAHIRIIVAIEAAFGIRFNTAEMAKLPTVGALADLIARKIS